MKRGYLKFVQWNEEDRCYAGYCPDLFIGGVCHGADERKVYGNYAVMLQMSWFCVKRHANPFPASRPLWLSPLHDASVSKLSSLLLFAAYYLGRMDMAPALLNFYLTRKHEATKVWENGNQT